MSKTLEDRLKRKYHDLPDEYRSDFARIRDFTMVNVGRSFALWQAAIYVSRANIPGCFVECGVWRGGQSMLAALAFIRTGHLPDMHLYDTFAGMSEPTANDVRGSSGVPARKKWAASQAESHNEWCYASIEEVRSNMESTGYPPDKIHYHVGMVEQTLAEPVPDQIAVLRLDTDWYESTKIEMEVLFPKTSRGGILIIDDYGTWKGSRIAVDEYLEKTGINLYLIRDGGGRIAMIP